MKIIDDLAPTRQSLLFRLKDWQDQASWKEFFDTYWRLIYNTALKAGLSDAEAQDAVQETILSVAKSMPTFEYDKTKGSFKGWLLQLTRWRIDDQFRKRQRGIESSAGRTQTATGTSTVDRVADPAGPALEAIWDDEWENNLTEFALERIKRKVDAKQYQLFELSCVRQWPLSKVASTLKVSSARVYMARHRIGRLLRKEVTYLRSRTV